MDAPAREDYLEAILNLTGSRQKPPALQELVEFLGKDTHQTLNDLRDLRDQGDLLISPEKTIVLTAEGRKTAECISRRHRLLQSFLTEMLGIEPARASDEACMLEHAVSDETIDRLGQYLDGPGIPHCRRRARHARRSATSRRLTDFGEETDLYVREVQDGREVHRLIDLGIVPGEKIRLVRKLGNHAVVVRVKGCDIALSDEVASSILVESVP